VKRAHPIGGMCVAFMIELNKSITLGLTCHCVAVGVSRRLERVGGREGLTHNHCIPMSRTRCKRRMGPKCANVARSVSSSVT
jgi:hypothetical protein